MPSYLFSTAKQKGRKENRKELRKRGELTCYPGARPTFSAGPAHQGAPLSSSPGTSTQLRARHAAAVAVAASQPRPCLLLDAMHARRRPTSYFALLALWSVLPARVRRRPKNPAED